MVPTFISPILYFLISALFVLGLSYLLWTNGCSTPNTTESPVRVVSIPIPKHENKNVLQDKPKEVFLVIPHYESASIFLQEDLNKVLRDFSGYGVELASTKHVLEASAKGKSWPYNGWTCEGHLIRPHPESGGIANDTTDVSLFGYHLYGYKPSSGSVVGYTILS